MVNCCGWPTDSAGHDVKCTVALDNWSLLVEQPLFTDVGLQASRNSDFHSRINSSDKWPD